MIRSRRSRPALALALAALAACNPKGQEARALADSCDDGDAAACGALAVQTRKGDHVLKDWRRAAELFGRACEGGQGASCVRLAHLHLDPSAGRRGVPFDSARAAGFLETGCDRGAMQGCTELGDMYAQPDSAVPDRTPKGPAHDIERATALYDRACGGGGMVGCARLGGAHLAGEGAPPDTARAIALFREACDGGAGIGCARLGEAYAAGTGVDPDPVEAARLFESSCESEMLGCFRLAALLAQGAEGVERDAERAVELYDKACDGTMSDGEGSEPVAESCARLGDMFATGVGVERNVYRAGSAFRRACRLGWQEACSRS